MMMNKMLRTSKMVASRVNRLRMLMVKMMRRMRRR